MRSPLVWYFFAVVLVSCLMSSSANNPADELNNFLAASPDTNRFKNLWAPLKDAVSFSVRSNGSVEYTILIPVDSAFTDTPIEFDNSKLRYYLTSHILQGDCKVKDLVTCGSAYSSSSLLHVANTLETAKTWSKFVYQPRVFIYDDDYIYSATGRFRRPDFKGALAYVNGARVIDELRLESAALFLIDQVLVERDRGVTALAFLSPKGVAAIQVCDLCNRDFRTLLLATGPLSRVRLQSQSQSAFELIARLLREDQSGGVTVFFPAEQSRNYVAVVDDAPELMYRLFVNAIIRGFVLFTPAFRAGSVECLRSSIAPELSANDAERCLLRIRRFGPSSSDLLVTNSRAMNSLIIVTANVPLTNGVVHFVDGVFIEASDFETLRASSLFPTCDNLVRRALPLSNVQPSTAASLVTVFVSDLQFAGVLSSYTVKDTRRTYLSLSSVAFDRDDNGTTIRYSSVQELTTENRRNQTQFQYLEEPYTIVDIELPSGLFVAFRFVQPDLLCASGILHILTPLHLAHNGNISNRSDLEVTPPSLYNLIKSRRDLTITFNLLNLLDFGSLLGHAAVTGSGVQPHQQYTVFAPTDAAWLRFLASRNLTVEELPAAFAKRNAFGRVAQRHVVLHAYKFSRTVTPSVPRTIEMQQGHYVLSADTKPDSWFVAFNGVRQKVLSSDYVARNGLLHVLDNVLTTPNDFGISRPAESALRVDSLTSLSGSLLVASPLVNFLCLVFLVILF